jgi:hypothetical protein
MTSFKLPHLTRSSISPTYITLPFIAQYNTYVENMETLTLTSKYVITFHPVNIYHTKSTDMLGNLIIAYMYPLRNLKKNTSIPFEQTRNNLKYCELTTRLHMDPPELIGWHLRDNIATLVSAPTSHTKLINSPSRNYQQKCNEIEHSTLTTLCSLQRNDIIIIRIPYIKDASFVSIIALCCMDFDDVTLHHMIADDILYLHCIGFKGTLLTPDIVETFTKRIEQTKSVSLFTEEYHRSPEFVAFAALLLSIGYELYNWRYDICSRALDTYMSLKRIRSIEFNRHVNIILEDIYKDVSKSWAHNYLPLTSG